MLARPSATGQKRIPSKTVWVHTHKLPYICNLRNAICAAILTGAAVAEQVDFRNMKPTPELLLEAKKHPDGWVYVITGNYGSKDAVPPEAIAGAWKVDLSGDIVPGSFQLNPKYAPKQGNK
jgi:hypothetical protein